MNKEKIGMNLWSYPNVRLVGKGKKVTEGLNTGRDAIVIGVTQKLPRILLRKREIIPSTYKGVETDVIEVGEIRALRTTKHRPAPGGVSIGHPQVTAGTLGMVIRSSDARYILSNNHVLANSNNAQIGDPIYQPGVHDGGGVGDTIAHLVDFIPIGFSEVSTCPIANLIANVCNWIAEVFNRQTRLKAVAEPINLVDCAIALPENDADVSDEILEIGIPCGFDEVRVGDRVKKSGRTTGLNYGEVTITDATARVNYGVGTAMFAEQIITTKLAEGGDSGSVVLNEENNVIGLLFAGSENVTIVNNIFNVMDLLEITY